MQPIAIGANSVILYKSATPPKPNSITSAGYIIILRESLITNFLIIPIWVVILVDPVLAENRADVKVTGAAAAAVVTV